MKLAVILPVYNTAAYLAECLDSLLNQTFQDFCILAVNDGSRDHSGDILEQYAQHDSRLHVFHFEHNQGGASAGNFVLNLSQKMRVDYVARADSDDIYLPHRFERQIQFLEQHQEIHIISSNMTPLHSGQTLTVSQLPQTDDLIKVAFVAARANIANPSSMWRNAFFKQHQIAYGNFPTADDYAMWIQCALHGAQFANLPDSLAYYRIHDQQQSQAYRVTDQAVMQILPRYLSAIFPQLNPQQSMDLARICYGDRDITARPEQIQEAYHIVHDIQHDTQSVLGENKRYAIEYIKQRMALWQKIVPLLPQQRPVLSSQIVLEWKDPLSIQPKTSK